MLNEDILKDLDSLDDESQSVQNNLMNLQDDNQNEQAHNDTQIHKGINHISLLYDEKFIQHMQDINNLIDSKLDGKQTLSKVSQKQYIHKSNQYAQKIDREIQILFRIVKQIYSLRFPQLQSIVTKPALYCKSAYEIQCYFTKLEGGLVNSIDQLVLPFLSSHQSISLKISISSLHEQLSKQSIKKLNQNVQKVLLLYEHHNALMIFLEGTMQMVAPNLCQLVGSAIASKLISAAGGLDRLVAMPACNVQLLGGQRAGQLGFGLIERNHTGIFGTMELVKEAPKRFQMQLVRMLASNAVKCAKADKLGSKNNLGARFKQQMFERFEKIQEQGGLMRTQKPLQIPDLQPKKKRGGKRHRKTKELYEMSEVRKNQNRIQFGLQAEQQYGQQGEGLGMLKVGMGKLKVHIKKQKLNVSKKMSQRMQKKSGMYSTLDFGSKQGIQLINPSLSYQKKQTSGISSYFSKQSGFRTILNNKFGPK